MDILANTMPCLISLLVDQERHHLDVDRRCCYRNMGKLLASRPGE